MQLKSKFILVKKIFTVELYLDFYKDKIKYNLFDEGEIHKSYNFTYKFMNIKNIFLKNIIFLFNVLFLNNLKKIIHLIKFKFSTKSEKVPYNLDDLIFNSKDLKNFSEFYKKNGYCFVENFLDENSYNTILNYWPSDIFFPPRLSPTKYYSFSFGFENQNYDDLKKKTANEKIQTVKNIEFSPILKKLYNFILSEQNENNFSSLYGPNEYWKCYLIFSTIAHEGAYLIPHKDKVNYNQEIMSSFNVSFFLDGMNDDPVQSGALGLYQDNKFKQPIFIPNNLKNSLLIYDTKKNFFHGFPRIGEGGHRKTINIAFLKDKIKN